MYFKQVLNERCGCASYVIASRQTREAAVIDPAVDTEPYDALLRERDFHLRYVIDTHIHATGKQSSCGLMEWAGTEAAGSRGKSLIRTAGLRSSEGRVQECRFGALTLYSPGGTVALQSFID